MSNQKCTSRLPDVPEITYWPHRISPLSINYVQESFGVWNCNLTSQIQHRSWDCVVPCFVWALGADLRRMGSLPLTLVGSQPHRNPAHRRATLVRVFLGGTLCLSQSFCWKHKLWPFCVQLVADIALGGSHAISLFCSAMQGIPFKTSVFTHSRWDAHSAWSLHAKPAGMWSLAL